MIMKLLVLLQILLDIPSGFLRFNLIVEGSSLVIVHDGSLSSDSSLADKSNSLTELVFQSISIATELTIRKLEIRSNVTEEVIWKVGSNSSFLTFGKCELLSSVSQFDNSTILHIHSSPCSHIGSGQIIPFYVGMGSRTDQCLVPEVTHWININKHKKSNYVWRKNVTKRNYRDSYLSCLGKENSERLLNYVSTEDNIKYSQQLEHGRRILNGKELTIATIERPPFVTVRIKNNTVTEAKGFCILLLDIFASKYNFTYSLVLPYDGNWGTALPNGTVNGMIGMVHRKEVDFALSAISITQDRESVIDFSNSFYEEPSTILIPAPKEKSNVLAFLDPFTYKVWVTIVALIGIVSPIMWILGSYYQFQPLLYPYEGDTHRDSLLKCFWDCSITLVGQNRNKRLTESSRLLMGVWRMASIIMIYTYTSILTAFLTVPVMESTISSLEDLVNQDKILWTYRRGAAHEQLFGGASPPGTYFKVAQLIREHPNFMVNFDIEGINSVLYKKMAFIKEKSFLDFAMGQDYLTSRQCRLKQVPQQFFIVGYGIALQQKSVYLPLFNKDISEMAQSGLFAKWKRNLWPKPNECSTGSGKRRSGSKALTARNLGGHFLILGVGLFFALLVFIIEKLSPKVSCKYTNDNFLNK